MNAFAKFKHNLLRSGLEFFGLYYSVYDGKVIDNVDPENKGRLKISCPKVWGNDTEVNKLVTPRGIFSGKKIGFHAMPQIGDVIWITFRNGHPDYPLWEYGWWVNDGQIELAAKDIYVFATPKGHVWVIDESKDTIFFSFKDGKTIEITGDNINLGTLGGSAEPAVLGDKNAQLNKDEITEIENLITQIETYATTQSTAYTGLIAASVPPFLAALAPGFTALKVANENILAGMIAIKTKLATLKSVDTDATKSEVVTLD